MRFTLFGLLVFLIFLFVVIQLKLSSRKEDEEEAEHGAYRKVGHGEQDVHRLLCVKGLAGVQVEEQHPRRQVHIPGGRRAFAAMCPPSSRQPSPSVASLARPHADSGASSSDPKPTTAFNRYPYASRLLLLEAYLETSASVPPPSVSSSISRGRGQRS